MLLKVKARAAGTAAYACLQAAKVTIETDRVKFLDECYEELIGAAVRNGFNVSDSTKAEMMDVAKRDTEQRMERHESTHVIEAMLRFGEMCAYDLDGDVYLDHVDFKHLKDHLPTS